MAVDEFVRGVGDGVADLAAGAASGGHYIIVVLKKRVDVCLKGFKID